MGTEKVICDTDVMIDYLDQKKKRHHEARKIIENNIQLDQVVLTAVSKMELLAGASNKREISEIDKSLLRFNLLLLNEEITLRALQLMLKYRCSHGLALPDCLIAAMVLHTGLPLFTYNKKDFKFIEGLRFYEPADNL